jgi:hypothetical protein
MVVQLGIQTGVYVGWFPVYSVTRGIMWSFIQEKMGVQWDSASAIYRFQESL